MSRRIFGQLGRLKADKIAEYEALHGAPWPEVIQTIYDCNLRNYSIFRHDDLVFACFEYVGEDYEADMAKMDADPATQRWADVICPLLRFIDDGVESSDWTALTEVYHLD